MFDVSFSELLLIALVALIVLGPQRLPEVARTAGQWLGKLRRFVSDVKQDLDREMNQSELAELRKLKAELDDTRRVMEDASQRLLQDVNPVPANTAEPAATPSLDTLMPPPAKPVGSEHVIGTPLATKPVRVRAKRKASSARRVATKSKPGPKARKPHGRAKRIKRR
jgi:sec-independent protein translocase protein TatB